MVAAAQAGGFNTLLVQVRGRGDAYYRARWSRARPSSRASRRSIRSPSVLEDAHAAGLKVHAWVAVNLVSSSVTLPASRDHVIYRAPEWLMVPRELAAEMKKIDLRSPAYVGRLARWTRAHRVDRRGPLRLPAPSGRARPYGGRARRDRREISVDGVHLDYIRFPNEDFDYSPSAMDQFKASIVPDLTERERRDVAAREVLDPAAYPNLFPERWSDFRRSRLTSLVIKLRTAVKTGPARHHRQRRGGARRAAGLHEPAAGLARLDRSVAARRDLPDGVHGRIRHLPEADRRGARLCRFESGVGRHRRVPAVAGADARHIAAANKLGVAGIILFSYESLAAPPNSAGSVSQLGRAAFGSAPE